MNVSLIPRNDRDVGVKMGTISKTFLNGNFQTDNMPTCYEVPALRPNRKQENVMPGRKF
jgi:hypothetical protein